MAGPRPGPAARPERLGRTPGGEDLAYRERVLDRGDHAQPPATARARQHVDTTSHRLAITRIVHAVIVPASSRAILPDWWSRMEASAPDRGAGGGPNVRSRQAPHAG